MVSTESGGETPQPGKRLSLRTAAFVVLGNLVPILGVIFLGWNATQILVLYWVENVVIGLTTLPRILTARVVAPTSRPGPGTIQIDIGAPLGRALLAAFFVVHYGIFCLGHAVFATLLIADGGGRPWDVWLDTFADRDFRLAVLAVVGVQVVLLVKDWWLSGLWRRSDAGTEMGRPYGRIIVLHLTVILGAWLLTGLGAPASAVITLCLVKTAMELFAGRAPDRAA